MNEFIIHDDLQDECLEIIIRRSISSMYLNEYGITWINNMNVCWLYHDTVEIWSENGFDIHSTSVVDVKIHLSITFHLFSRICRQKIWFPAKNVYFTLRHRSNVTVFFKWSHDVSWNQAKFARNRQNQVIWHENEEYTHKCERYRHVMKKKE